MSRIGNRKLTIPANVNVSVESGKVHIVSQTAKLSVDFPVNLISVDVVDNTVKVSRANDEKQTKMFHGTVNANVANALVGVTTGWKKELEVKGVGFRAKVEGSKLNLGLGFSHPLLIQIPTGLKVETPSATEISINGADKAAVGAFAAVVRAYRKPEPYKGKGVMYKGERIVRKAGKTADKKK